MLLLKSSASSRSVDSALPLAGQFLPFTFITHQSFDTQILAYMLDSLVRVSRRVNRSHFVKIATYPELNRPVSTQPLAVRLLHSWAPRNLRDEGQLRFLKQTRSIDSYLTAQPKLGSLKPLSPTESTWSWLTCCPVGREAATQATVL